MRHYLNSSVSFKYRRQSCRCEKKNAEGCSRIQGRSEESNCLSRESGLRRKGISTGHNGRCGEEDRCQQRCTLSLLCKQGRTVRGDLPYRAIGSPRYSLFVF